MKNMPPIESTIMEEIGFLSWVKEQQDAGITLDASELHKQRAAWAGAIKWCRRIQLHEQLHKDMDHLLPWNECAHEP